MKTTIPSVPPRGCALIRAREFPKAAARLGITESARTLILAGRLVPLQVGRRAYYRWDDLRAISEGR